VCICTESIDVSLLFAYLYSKPEQTLDSTPTEQELSSDTDVISLNGLSFGEREVYIPEEIMEYILSRCDSASLVRLSEVNYHDHDS
jgi:hypothetical protein